MWIEDIEKLINELKKDNKDLKSGIKEKKKEKYQTLENADNISYSEGILSANLEMIQNLKSLLKKNKKNENRKRKEKEKT